MQENNFEFRVVVVLCVTICFVLLITSISNMKIYEKNPFAAYNKAIIRCGREAQCLEKVNEFYKQTIIDLSKPIGEENVK